MQKSNIDKFRANLIRLATAKICKTNKEEETEEIVITLSKRVTLENDIEKTIEEFYEVLTAACNESFRTQLAHTLTA